MTSVGRPSPTPAITRAGAADASVIARLAERAYAHYMPVIGSKPVPMTADYPSAIRDHEVWVIREAPDGVNDGTNDGAIAASLVLVVLNDHLLLESIAVDPDRQGRGLGRALLEWTKARARSLGHDEVRLYTNVLMTSNRALYKRAGYTETREERRGDKHIVHMRLVL